MLMSVISLRIWTYFCSTKSLNRLAIYYLEQERSFMTSAKDRIRSKEILLSIILTFWPRRDSESAIACSLDGGIENRGRNEFVLILFDFI